jgi:hypothetical protein
MPIPLAIPLAMGAVGGISKLFAGAKAGQAAGMIDDQISDLKTWYEGETSKDYLQSNLARGVLENVLGQIEEREKRAESTAAITGATEGSKLAEKEQSRKMYTDTVQDLARYGEAREQQLGREYRATLSNLLGQKGGLMRESAANVSQAGGSLLGAGAELFGYGVGAPGAGTQTGIPRTYSPELKSMETKSVNEILGGK